MAVPNSLAERMALFEESGVVAKYRDGLFLEPSWLAVYLGQRIEPRSWDPLSERLPVEALAAAMEDLRRSVERTAEAMPAHDAFVKSCCAAA